MSDLNFRRVDIAKNVIACFYALPGTGAIGPVIPAGKPSLDLQSVGLLSSWRERSAGAKGMTDCSSLRREREPSVAAGPRA